MLAVVDDATGKTTAMPGAHAPGSEPAAVQFPTDSNYPQGTQMGVKDSTGKLAFSGSLNPGMAPALLEPGTYTITSWVDGSAPQCHLGISLAAKEDLSVAIKWDQSGGCSITAAP